MSDQRELANDVKCRLDNAVAENIRLNNELRAARKELANLKKSLQRAESMVVSSHEALGRKLLETQKRLDDAVTEIHRLEVLANNGIIPAINPRDFGE